jgi:hypothetical protein
VFFSRNTLKESICEMMGHVTYYIRQDICKLIFKCSDGGLCDELNVKCALMNS